MAERVPPTFPPVGEPDRFDAIVSRGRSMRRRRQLGIGAGVGGTAVAAVVAVALLAGTGPSTERVVVDPAAGDTSSTTSVVSTTVTSTAPAPPEMSVQIAIGQPTLIVVDDPSQVVDPEARQCVLVTLGEHGDDPAAPAAAEGHACSDPGSDGSSTVTVDVFPTGGAQVGCAATATRADPATATPAADTPATQRARTTFQLSTPDVPGGTYSMTVSATSGVGDGCAGGDTDPPVREVSAGAVATLTLP